MVFRILSSLLTMSNKSLSSSLSKYSSMLTNSLGNNASKRIDDYYVPLYVKLKSQLDNTIITKIHEKELFIDPKLT